VAQWKELIYKEVVEYESPERHNRNHATAGSNTGGAGNAMHNHSAGKISGWERGDGNNEGVCVRMFE